MRRADHKFTDLLLTMLARDVGCVTANAAHRPRLKDAHAHADAVAPAIREA